MKKTIQYLFAMVLALGLGSCAKDGGVGPMGPEGKEGREGTQGAEGKQGIPGTDGKMIHYGNALPAANVGQEGDFYIDKSNSNLYGPKTSTGWGAASSMKGATGDRGATGATGPRGDKGATGDRGAAGATGPKGDKGATGDRGATGATGPKGDAGAAGSQFLSGSTDPNNSLGKTGDFYFNRSSGTLFGPKTTAWAAGVNLKGEKGDKGDKGDKGEDGKNGNANVTTYGWTIITHAFWKNMVGVDGLVFTRPGDKQLRVVDKIFYVNSENITGAVLVYSDRGQGINMLPFKSLVTSTGYSGTVEFRFVYDEQWLYIVAALIDGTWNQTYMEQTYLPSIKWKLVLIPEMLAKAQADALTKLNLTNYEVVSAHFNLKD